MTGREALVSLITETLEIPPEKAITFLNALRDKGYVCVPATPTGPMVSASWAEALAENAVGVWETMIGVWEGVLTAEGIPKEEAEQNRRASDIPENGSSRSKL